ncbi:PQ loop repeat-domain-containing protein [Spinellus fusiger]|nr:PQ loop repeat-domain-containing protein [Spinellus fusiger]
MCMPVEENRHYAQWIYMLSGDCVYEWQETFSLLVGYLSIFFWLDAQIPQVIKNYRLHSAESLSISFLIIWLAGDISNYIGCVITNQLPFQRYLSIYFIIIDTVLCLQWAYYGYSNAHSPLGSIDDFSDAHVHIAIKPQYSEQDPLVHSSSFTYNTASRTVLAVSYLSFASISTTLTTSSEDGVIFTVSQQQTIWVGRFFAWLCTCLYLSSRLPQIIRNYKRHSVHGLSMALFFCAAMGNLTYCISIFTNPHTTGSSLLEAAPYLIGSTGTLAFDGAIFLQYMVYPQKAEEFTTDVEDLNGLES